MICLRKVTVCDQAFLDVFSVSLGKILLKLLRLCEVLRFIPLKIFV